MGEHRIRLRGAWDMEVGLGEGEERALRRVDLPIAWPPDAPAAFRLLRRFGRPPLDPDREAARLEVSEAPGVVAAWVNGREVARLLPGTVAWSVPLAWPLLPRNALVLEVDRAGIPPGAMPPAWGSVALVIAPRGPA